MMTGRGLLCRRQMLGGAIASGAVAGAGLAAAQAAEPDPALEATAKREGRVVWYSTSIVNQLVRPMVAAFEARYGIKVDAIRGSANDLALRLLAEARAGRVQADVFDGGGQLAALRSAGVVAPWLTQADTGLPAGLIDQAGCWAATNMLVLTPGTNTAAIPPAKAPRTLQDLLDRGLRKRMLWNVNPTMTGAPGFVGMVLSVLGETEGRAYLTALARQEIIGVAGSARQVLDQLIAGEADLALHIVNTNAVISAAKGAPVAWIPMQPCQAYLSVTSMTRNGPHPAAGRLLARFLLSHDGQRVFREAGYIPSDPGVPPLDPTLRPDGTALKAILVTPEEVDAHLPQWVALHKEIFADA